MPFYPIVLSRGVFSCAKDKVFEAEHSRYIPAIFLLRDIRTVSLQSVRDTVKFNNAVTRAASELLAAL